MSHLYTKESKETAFSAHHEEDTEVARGRMEEKLMQDGHGDVAKSIRAESHDMLIIKRFNADRDRTTVRGKTHGDTLVEAMSKAAGEPTPEFPLGHGAASAERASGQDASGGLAVGGSPGLTLCRTEVLGQGAFGSVYMGSLVDSRGGARLVAVKEFHAPAQFGNSRDPALVGIVAAVFNAEVAALGALNHPCIVKLVGVCDRVAPGEREQRPGGREGECGVGAEAEEAGAKDAAVTVGQPSAAARTGAEGSAAAGAAGAAAGGETKACAPPSLSSAGAADAAEEASSTSGSAPVTPNPRVAMASPVAAFPVATDAALSPSPSPASRGAAAAAAAGAGAATAPSVPARNSPAEQPQQQSPQSPLQPRFLIMDVAAGRSIRAQLTRSVRFSHATLASTAAQLCSALAHCHSRGVVHRDVKCANLLLAEDGKVMLADFGGSWLRFTGEPARCGREIVSPLWSAPEVLRGEAYDESADVWSMGCVVIEMASGNRPWEEKGFVSAQQASMMIGKSEGPEWARPELAPMPALPPNGRHFASLCLQRDPKRRPTAKQLLQHPWIRDYVAEQKLDQDFPGASSCSLSSASASASSGAAAAVDSVGSEVTPNAAAGATPAAAAVGNDAPPAGPQGQLSAGSLGVAEAPGAAGARAGALTGIHIVDVTPAALVREMKRAARWFDHDPQPASAEGSIIPLGQAMSSSTSSGPAPHPAADALPPSAVARVPSGRCKPEDTASAGAADAR